MAVAGQSQLSVADWQLSQQQPYRQPCQFAQAFPELVIGPEGLPWRSEGQQVKKQHLTKLLSTDLSSVPRPCRCLNVLFQ